MTEAMPVVKFSSQVLRMILMPAFKDSTGILHYKKNPEKKMTDAGALDCLILDTALNYATVQQF